MKKAAVLAVVALPLVAYTGGAWYLGQRIENSHNAQAKQTEGIPNVKLVKRDYQRGVFSSTETVVIELMGDTARALQATGEEAIEPIRLTVRTDIRHGPWIGGAEFDAGVAQSELVLEGEALEAVRKVFGDRKPLDIRTVYHFAGGGRSDLSSPAFVFDMPADDDDDAMRVTWDGITARIDFAEGMTQYTMSGAAPKLEVTDAAGSRMAMTGLAFSGDQTRLFDDDPLLYAGSQRFTVDAISFHDRSGSAALPKVELAKLVYEVDIPKDGDFVDLVARIGAEKFEMAGTGYGPAHYDFSLRHLHARTTSRLYRSFMTMSADPALMTNPQAMQAQMGQLMGPAIELLGHAPVVAIDRLAFNTPQGPTSLSAKVSLPGITPDELANPLGLLGKVDASGALSLPEALVRSMMVERNKAGLLAVVGDEADPDDIAAMADAQFEQTLQPLTAQGYVTRADGQLSAKIAFSKGQLTVNGLPFNPAAMAQPAPSERPE